MGSGSWTTASYSAYNSSAGKSYDVTTNRVINQVFTQHKMDDSLNPRLFSIRECVNSDEHPNTIPIILALDVTGSMGRSCKETAEALGVIMESLYEKHKDIEFCVMGIGDLAYDSAPIQMSQFESDVRIAEALDKIYMERGGGGNAYESYTAAWWMGLNRTSLDRINKQGKKGIIITMGDEPLNPYLPHVRLAGVTGDVVQADVETKDLYAEVIEKFDVYHLAVDGGTSNCYKRYEDDITKSYGEYLDENHLFVTNLNSIAGAIVNIVTNAVNGSVTAPVNTTEISW